MNVIRQFVRYFRSLLIAKKYALIVLACLLITSLLLLHSDNDGIACKTDYSPQNHRNIRDIPTEQLEKLKQKWLAEQQQVKSVVVGDEPPDPDSKAQVFAPVECLINDDYTVQCLKSNNEHDNIYMPFDFLEKYFDVTGKMKHYDGYDRFEFSQSFSKVFYVPKTPYTYHGLFMTFDSYNVESRDRVKCISGVEGVPLSSQWGQHGYFYPIQIAQFGLTHYCKNIVQKPPQRTVYEDAESTSQSKWKTSNRYCTVESVTDSERGSKVMQFSTPESIPLGSGVSLIVGNTMEYELSFDVKFKSNGSITVVVDTSDKTKQYTLHYMTSSTMMDFDQRSNIFYGIGPTRHWRHISRDLLTDLRKGTGYVKSQQTKNKLTIQKVARIIIRGEGFIDNITVSTNEHMTHFRDASDWIMKYQDKTTGGWKNDIERVVRGYNALPPGWISAMGQGQAMSLLCRAYYTFQNKLYIKALSHALLPYTIPSAEGGVRAVFMDKYVWFEEYPTTPSSFVLNGFIYSLIGLYDLKSLLEDRFNFGSDKETLSKPVEQAFLDIGVDIQKTYELCTQLFNSGMVSLKAMLPLYDGGSRTFYDLRHFVMKTQPNIARWDYHTTHLSQLALLSTISDDPIFKKFLGYWRGYLVGKTAKHN